MCNKAHLETVDLFYYFSIPPQKNETSVENYIIEPIDFCSFLSNFIKIQKKLFKHNNNVKNHFHLNDYSLYVDITTFYLNDNIFHYFSL
jgi:hypothetical protein